MTQLIALDRIDPTALCSHVRMSGLVTETQLLDAVAKQAPIAKQSMSFPKRTELVAAGANSISMVWKRSQTEVFQQDSGVWDTDVVVGRVLTTGVHGWKFRATEKSNCLFGIASAALEYTKCAYLGQQRGGWGFHSNGNLYWEGKSASLADMPTCSTNSTITLVLTLVAGNQNRLDLSIDGGPFVTLFEGSELVDDGHGFVPAASIYGKSSIGFLGFD